MRFAFSLRTSQLCHTHSRSVPFAATVCEHTCFFIPVLAFAISAAHSSSFKKSFTWVGPASQRAAAVGALSNRAQPIMLSLNEYRAPRRAPQKQAICSHSYSQSALSHLLSLAVTDSETHHFQFRSRMNCRRFPLSRCHRLPMSHSRVLLLCSGCPSLAAPL